MPKFFPFTSHFLDSYLTWINMNFDFLYMIHNNFAIIHLEENSFHFDLLKVFLQKFIHNSDISRVTENS